MRRPPATLWAVLPASAVTLVATLLMRGLDKRLLPSGEWKRAGSVGERRRVYDFSGASRGQPVRGSSARSLRSAPIFE